LVYNQIFLILRGSVFPKYSAFCPQFELRHSLLQPGNDNRVNSSAQTVITRFIRVIQDFLSMITYHAVGAVLTVRAECPGFSTVLSCLFLQPLRAAH
jgi:hypothetical protein